MECIAQVVVVGFRTKGRERVEGGKQRERVWMRVAPLKMEFLLLGGTYYLGRALLCYSRYMGPQTNNEYPLESTDKRVYLFSLIASGVTAQ